MPPQIYEVVSTGARYWFLFLMVVIVWRSYRWLARDRKQRKKRLRLLPDAGFVGELVVLTGNQNLPKGIALPVAREGVLGYLRSCDVMVPVKGVGKKHLWFQYADGEGLLVRPFVGNKVEVDGNPCENRRKGLCMLHGSRLTVGDAVLRLRMFAGFETIAHSSFRPEAIADPEEESPQAQTAAMTPQQLALWQAQQQWQQQYWMMASQALTAQVAQAQAAPQRVAPKDAVAPEEDEELDDEQPLAQAPACQEDVSPGEHPGLEEYVDPAECIGPAGSPSQQKPYSQVPAAYETVFDPVEDFYPPVTDEDASVDFWPYAPYPQTDAVFENQGYTYPEYVEPASEDEDLTDAAAAPKSLYVEPDEAELAKRVLWDKYLGGGRKR